MVKAIIEAAEEKRSPVIVFLWEEDIKMAGQGNLEGIVKTMAINSSIPVAIMLDHGTTVEFCIQCMFSGHTGVMIDASHDPLEENIATTRRVVDVAKMIDVFVEGEIGTISRTYEVTGQFSELPKYTDLEEAVKFANDSGVDAMAISIGSASGLYKEQPQLNFDLLRNIRKCTKVHLVLHGGSGIPPEQIQRAVAEGISGIRFATENRLAFFDAIEAKRKELGRDYPDSRLILRAGMDAAKACILERMDQMGCTGKA
jgi:fructose-bisphosphate aldolase class II